MAFTHCGDGKHISVGAIEGHFFRNLCRLLDLEQFSGSQYDAAKQEEMRAAFAQRFLTQSRDAWVELLAGADTCTAPVLSIAEVTANAHLRARQTFMNARHAEKGAFEQLGPILAGGERSQPEHQVRPAGETDTDTVFARAGFSGDEITRSKPAAALE
jgi:alpha-methylacyl-CoA racemase